MVKEYFIKYNMGFRKGTISMTTQLNMEEVWTTRSEKLGNRMFVGVQNQLPQTYEDEIRLFELIDLRKEEIKDHIHDENTYMIIHEEGSKMTVAVRVNECKDIPDGMVLLSLPEESYQVFRFEEKYICDFWKYFCELENQNKYNLSTVKARFETFNSSLQPNGITEIYFPKR
jgi:predicted transcriptional regulator YdeE